MSVSLRPAAETDLGFVSALALDPATEPFLMPGAGEEERLREYWLGGGLYLIEREDEGPVGALGLDVVSPRSRITQLNRLMVDPDERRRGIGLEALRAACRLVLVERGFHRLQAEAYGDNEAGQALFERAGFRREGIAGRHIGAGTGGSTAFCSGSWPRSSSPHPPGSRPGRC
ncbi:MAG TPA: GNAT family N-acetyltransferase [Solirubrobacteraceae bacterium]|nr:GNAT family N-acetyltransferase [Solirubrobacteraceae bacterium]